MEDAIEANPVAETRGDYELQRVIRKDPLGETWRALDRRSGEKVDLRMLPDWASLPDMEAFTKRIKTLSHPALVQTRELLVHEKGSAVVLDFSDGETIAQRRRRRPRRHFEVSEIKPWLRIMIDVLGWLHRNDLAHGAIHTGSFLLEGASLTLNDLAVSRLLRPQVQFDGGALLPLAVMSPQMMAGADPSPADDIYALGALVYDLLTSAPVFISGDISSQVTGAVPPTVQERRAQLEVSGVPIPPEWQGWLSAALAKDPAKRPPLDALAGLVRPGAQATSIPTTAIPPIIANSAPADLPEVVPAAPRKLPKWSLNQLAIGSSIVLCAAIFFAAYVLKIAPRKAFQRQLNADYTAAVEYDRKNPDDHQKVLARWSAFEGKWTVQVHDRYPTFQPVLDSAGQQRQLREDHLKQLAEDAAERLRGHVTKGRVEFIGTRADAAVALAKNPAAAIEIWEKFLATYDQPFEGGAVPAELSAELAEARLARDQVKATLEARQKQQAEALAAATGDLEKLRPVLNDPALSAAYKITQAEAFLTRLSSAPGSDPKIAVMREEVDHLLPDLRVAAGKETPAAPLDLKALFENSPCKDFSENGRKQILKNAQTALKTLGFYPGTPDGSPGKGTHEAIIAFQKSKNLVPSATLDERTLAELGLTGLADILVPLVNEDSAEGVTRASPRRTPDKSLLNKAGDTAKKIGKSIGNIFTGGN